jgi:predicted phage-related endonuclease
LESPIERLPRPLKGVESMAKSATLSTTTENTRKVSKVLVNKVSEMASLRTEIARLEKLANSLRNEVLAEVGTDPVVLIHNNIKVAKISVVITERPDLESLRTAFPDAWNAVKYDSPAVKISVIHEV